MVWKEHEDHQLQGLPTLLWCVSDRCSGGISPWESPGLVMHDPLSCCELQHMVSWNTQGYAVLWMVGCNTMLPTANSQGGAIFGLCPDSGHTAPGRMARGGGVVCFPQ